VLISCAVYIVDLGVINGYFFVENLSTHSLMWILGCKSVSRSNNYSAELCRRRLNQVKRLSCNSLVTNETLDSAPEPFILSGMLSKNSTVSHIYESCWATTHSFYVFSPRKKKIEREIFHNYRLRKVGKYDNSWFLWVFILSNPDQMDRCTQQQLQ